ncbi:hypothetical protein [Fulvivirga sediminis]|uniref:Uncharacterized protein n=1 Tax=Fulvivirga sediminis TaxID=2803949 RepID=A0A937F9B4_9BACT|nr:hypothetical protein [Fulvivirga sediminis]MBL3657382.1 hypothetical protein [Fulvivirga sediminis]
MMRFRILLLALVLNYHLGFSQDSTTLILVANKNGSNSTKVFSYPYDNILFSKDDFQDLNQKININKKGIYGISFATSHSFKRNRKMKVTRVQSSKKSVQLNTKVVSKEYYNAVTGQSPQAF